MKKIFLTLALSVGLAGLLFAQNGYKNLSWGMSRSQVSAILGKLVEVSGSTGLGNAGREAHYFFHPNVQDVPTKLSYGKLAPIPFTRDTPQIIKPTYYFSGGRFVAVQIVSNQQPAKLLQLEQEYGQATVKLANFSGGQNEVVAWRNANTIVVWDNYGGFGVFLNVGTITYIDRKWFEDVEQQSHAVDK